MSHKIVGGDNAVNIQAIGDISINVSPEVLESVLYSQLEALFKKIAQSDNQLKHEIVRLIRTGEHKQARALLNKLVDETSEKYSDDCLDFANLFMILEPKKAKYFYERSLDVDPENHNAINCYAIYLMGCGELEEAESLFSSRLSINSLPRVVREWINGNLGVLYKNQGKWEQSISCLLISLKLSKLNQNYIGVVKGLNNLGSVYNNLENYNKSEIYLQEALNKIHVIINPDIEVRLKNKYKVVKSNLLTNLSIRLRHLYIKDNDKDHLKKAICFLEEAIDIAEMLESKQEMLRHYGNLSNIYRQMDDNVNCKKYASKALDISKDIEDHRSEVCSLMNLGLAYYDENNFDHALTLLNEALKKGGDTYPKLRANILFGLAYVYRDAGNNEQMKEKLIQAEKLFKSLGLNDSLQRLTEDFAV
ncbi:MULTISPECIES: tetratricopeptide repeat protein [Plesiomonas]|uniref:tetratricopeptide repeat protein n=1 Tax=Plesiomonas TaxID=702 RepID=UPI001F1D3026|nr:MULTISPECIES: tetratricopeptide repeat protein [Plesiomonas]MCE5163744.1 tetratricopeptide repeat protein [Plesiomonas sp. PI-19]MCQ8859931.1 tetratricopeptide repeat protein [Plesiomonas shigelloides]